MLQSSVFQRLGKSLKASETEEVKAPLKLQTVVSTQPVTKKAIAAKPVKAMPGQKTSSFLTEKNLVLILLFYFPRSDFANGHGRSKQTKRERATHAANRRGEIQGNETSRNQQIVGRSWRHHSQSNISTSDLI